MIWTQIFMRTAVIFLVTMTMLANESDAEIRTLWISLARTEELKRAYSLETDGRRLYVGTQDGFYVSDDNGATWRMTGFEDYVNAFAVHGNTIYVASWSDVGMFRSDDRGETWKPINNGFRLFEDADGDITAPLNKYSSHVPAPSSP